MSYNFDLIDNETYKFAAKIFPEECGIDEKSLKEAIQNWLNPKKNSKLPTVIRRYRLPLILGLSLREVDRLIHPLKENNKIIAPAQLPTVRIGKKAIGVLEDDLLNFINSRKNIGNKNEA